MTKTTKAKPKPKLAAEGLLKALKFVQPATSNFEDWHEYVRLSNKQAVASDGVFSAGHPIEEELHCGPKLSTLVAGLTKCGDKVTITQSAGGSLVVKGGRLQATIPCWNVEDLEINTGANPDPVHPAIKPDPALMKAAAFAGVLASENAEEVISAAVFFDTSGTVFSTDRHRLIQVNHGISLPPGLSISKRFVQAVSKVKEVIVGYGIGWHEARGRAVSFTVHFEGGGWMKTQTFEDEQPNIARIFKNGDGNPREVPSDFFEAMATLEPFTNDGGQVLIRDEKVRTAVSEEHGAKTEVPDLRLRFCANVKYFPAFSWASKYEGRKETNNAGSVRTDALFFYGDCEGMPTRGALMGLTDPEDAIRREAEALERSRAFAKPERNFDPSEDIPF